MNALPTTGELFATNQVSPKPSVVISTSYVVLPHGWQITAMCMMWKMSKEKAANKIDGIVALAMASLEAVRGSSQPFAVLGAF